MEQVTVVKGASSGYWLRFNSDWLYESQNRKNIQYKASSLLQSIQKKSFSPPLSFFLSSKKKGYFFRNMASLRADDDPQASEYAGKDSPDDSDNDEGLYVETNVNVCEHLEGGVTIGQVRDLLVREVVGRSGWSHGNR